MKEGIEFIKKVAGVTKRLTPEQRLYAAYVQNPEWGNVILINVKPQDNSDSEKASGHTVTIVPEILNNYEMKSLFKRDGFDNHTPLTNVELALLEEDGIIVLSD